MLSNKKICETELKRQVTFKNIRYGMLVEVMDKDGSCGYHAGCKVHFFNKKGVLIGQFAYCAG